MLRSVASIVTTGLLLTSGLLTPQRSQTPATAAAASLNGALQAAVTRGDVPGLVAIAATRDRILYEGALGKADVAGNRPMTVEALFRIASMTKPVTSVAAMQLYERG